MKPFEPDLTSRNLTMERMNAIVFTPMDVRLRNQLITQAYGDIADAMTEVLGSRDASFCTVGQWASSAIAAYLNVPVPGLRRLVAHPFAYGNRWVFAEVSRAHVTFLDTIGRAMADGTDLDAAWAACDAGLRRRLPVPPGTPAVAHDHDPSVEPISDLADPVRSDNGDMIAGLRCHFDAARCDDDELRSLLIVEGNTRIAMHEQRQLETSITLGFRTWLRQLLSFWRLFQTKYEWHNQPPGRLRLWVEGRWVRFATRWLVKVATPWGSLPVRRVPDGGAHAIELTEELIDRWQLPFEVRPRGARCWADYDDRMSYITRLFAAEQRNAGWFTAGGLSARPVVNQEIAKRIAKRAKRIASTDQSHPDPGPAPISDRRLESMRQLRTHAFDGEGLPGPADVEADVRERIATVRAEGAPLDDEVVRRARRWFDDNRTSIYMGLLFGSLPDAYAAARGVRVLALASDFSTDPFRRAGETARFLEDILDPGTADDVAAAAVAEPFSESTVAYASLRGLRAMHARVSVLLERHPNLFDTAELGLPVNQEDVLGTMLTFVTGPMEMFDRIGLRVDREDADAYTSFWCGIGHILGLPLDAVTVEDDGVRRALTFAEAERLMHVIRARNHEPSMDGVRLTEALLHGIGAGFPRWLDWVPLGMVHAVGDRHINGHLLIGEGRGRRRASLVAAAMRFVFAIPGIRRAGHRGMEAVGSYWLRPFLDVGVARPYRRSFTAAEESQRRPAVVEIDPELWPRGC